MTIWLTGFVIWTMMVTVILLFMKGADYDD